MVTRTQRKFSMAAQANELLIAEVDGESMGIGTREELQGLIDEGVLPAETTLREAAPSDF